MKLKKLLLFLTAILFFNSCSDDTDCCVNPEPDYNYDSGLLVLNEGNFGTGNASVTFIDPALGTIEKSIFKNVNGRDLGDTAQSIKLSDDLALIVVNGSAKIEVVNRFTFESIATIDTNLENPRYAEIIGNYIYVSNWGDGTNPNDDFIAVFDLADFGFVQSISVKEGPEKLISAAGKLYVAHKGGFGFNNIVSVIETASQNVVEEITVGYVPNSMFVSGNNLYLLAGGKPSYADEETGGKLSVINITTHETVSEFEFAETSFHPNHIYMNNNEVFMTEGNKLYKYSSSLSETANFDLSEVGYLYGADYSGNSLYVAAPDPSFTGNGNILVYDLSDGSMINDFEVGVNPNSVYFNY